MVGHLAPRVAAPVEACPHTREHLQLYPTIVVAEIDRLAAIAARGDVIQTAGKLDAKRTGHSSSPRSCLFNGKTCPLYLSRYQRERQDPTLSPERTSSS